MSAQTFHYYSKPFENSKVPCIIRESASGGDPHVICTVGRVYNPDALYELCKLANATIEQQSGEI
jgi:hypothetical protein